MKIKRTPLDANILAPLSIALFSVLALWASNFSQMEPVAAVRPILTALLAGAALYGLLRWITRSAPKAGLLSAYWILLFVTYGHIYGLLEPVVVGGFAPGRHRFLILIWLMLLLVGTIFVLRKGYRLSFLCWGANRIGLLLVGMALIQLLFLQFRPSFTHKPVRSPAELNTSGLSAGNFPDVYYIILDSYSREDVLSKYYEFDNSEFLNELRNRGFVIPDCTQSNYAYTALVIPSTFNMDYFDSFSAGVDTSAADLNYYQLREHILHNEVRDNFTALGYTYVTIETAFPWLNVDDSDIYYRTRISSLFLLQLLELTDFDSMLVDTSLLRVVSEAGALSPRLQEALDYGISRINVMYRKVGKVVRSKNQIRYDHVMSILDTAEKTPRIVSPKFVYIHVVAPHPPIVFNEKGQFAPETSLKIGYPKEIQYLNQRMLTLIDLILSQSSRPPVIVLQGDHGWGTIKENRQLILNAYYLPDGGSKLVYPTITPVNTFRIIFNHYFGGYYPLLEDITYYSPDEDQYNFKIIPATCVTR